MASFDIDGSWEGEYSYNPSEAFPVPPPSVHFTLTAQVEGFGAFEGVIQDDPELGVPEPAIVRGQMNGHALIFTKRNSTLFVYHSGRSVPLHEYMDAEFGIPVDHEVPGLVITYEGEYDFAEEVVLGTWHMNPWQVRFRSNGQLRRIDLPAVIGGWGMRRPLTP